MDASVVLSHREARDTFASLSYEDLQQEEALP
jgi:hypothetical protein